MSPNIESTRLPTAEFLNGGGEMEQRIRAFDWSRTALGPLESWPQSLKTALKIALNSRYPIWMGWGPDLINLYNTPYIPVLGKRDEWALGASARDVWKEIWEEHLGPQADAVLLRGEASWNDQRQLVMCRNGYAEETYFTFSFSPLPADGGGIGGLFCACTEDTQKVLGERRLAALRHLAAATADARTEQAAAAIAVNTCMEHNADLSFALIYLITGDGERAELAAIGGTMADAPWAPRCIPLTTDAPASPDAWPLRDAVEGGTQIVLGIAAERRLPGGRWPEPASVAAVVPLAKAGHEKPRGFLVVGASPRLPFDNNYKSFFELLGRGTADALSNARAYEDEKRRAEALAELDRAKTTFFSNVSHEFRTPLTLMLDPLEEALKDAVSESHPAHKVRLEFAYRSSRRLLKLVNSLLDFARIEGGRMEASYEPTDLSAMTADLAGMFRSAMEQAQLQLEVDCPPLSSPVYVDRDMWEKIVLNLLSNALKFTFQGGISVNLKEEASSEGQAAHHIILEVRDTGTGIPEDQLEKVFERFHRVPGARGRSIEGTGIGLALVKQLVQLHGGTIHVTSTMDHGSVFTVRIPFGSAHLPQDHIRGQRSLASTATRADVFVEEALRWLPSDTTSEAIGSDVHEPPAGRPSPDRTVRHRVLVADDNADMRSYLCRLLDRCYEVSSAADGQTALERIVADPPDLVLADVMMPALDGFGLVQELRNNSKTRTIPIILLSARAGEESRIEGLERGADDYLIKPFSAKELLARVAAHLDIARIRREAEQAMRRQNEQFEILLNQAPLGVYLVNADFRIVLVNPMALPVFGDIPNLIGRDFNEVVHILWEKPYADEILLIFRRTLQTGEPYIAPERIERRLDRGVTESYEWRVDRMVLPDGRFGVVCYFRDVSAQVLAREALRRSEERLREFASQLEQVVAERTLDLVQSQARLRALATELNLAEQRERKRLATELHDHLQQMLVLGKLKLGQGMRLPPAADRIVEIMKQTDDVLAEALQYTRTLVAELSPPVLHEHGLAAGLLWLGSQMKRHDLNVTVQVPETEMALPEDQAVLLFQSVRELLINASKHAQSSEARVVLASADHRLTIEVTDNGIGFDVTDATVALTEASPQALSSKFGLFSIRERMKALGGTFDIRSDRGRGTAAVLSLPLPVQAEATKPTRKLEPSKESATMHQTPGAEYPHPSSARIRVLLVDDHAMVREGLRSVLESYTDVEIVGEASNGADALQMVEKLRPSLVVMDINMPAMNGIEATAHISRTYPEVLVIGLSVNATGTNVQAMLKAGAVLLLTKEAAVNELYRRMREVLTVQVGSGAAPG
jgi:PAS domain S-box-containing protein